MFIANQRAESSQPLPPHSTASPKHLFCNNYRCRRNKHTKKINENFDASKNTNMKFVFLLMLVPIRGEHKHWLFLFFFNSFFRWSIFFRVFAAHRWKQDKLFMSGRGSSSHRRDEVGFLVFCIFYLIWTSAEETSRWGFLISGDFCFSGKPFHESHSPADEQILK